MLQVIGIKGITRELPKANLRWTLGLARGGKGLQSFVVWQIFGMAKLGVINGFLGDQAIGGKR